MSILKLKKISSNPFGRVWVSFAEVDEKDEEVNIIPLPARYNPLKNLQIGDIYCLTNVDEIDNCPFVDFQLLQSPDFKPEMKLQYEELKNLITKTLKERNSFQVQLESRIILDNDLVLRFKIINENIELNVN